MNTSFSYTYRDNVFFVRPQSRNKRLFPHICGGEVGCEVLALPKTVGEHAMTYVDLTHMKGLDRVKVLEIPGETHRLLLTPGDFEHLKEIRVSEDNPYFSSLELGKEESSLGVLLVSRDAHKLYYCFPKREEEGACAAQIPRTVKKVYSLAFQGLKDLSLSFLNPKVKIAEGAFWGTTFAGENQQSVWFGNTLYRCNTKDALYVDRKITRCSPHAFDQCFPKTIQAEAYPAESFFRSMGKAKKAYRLEIDAIDKRRLYGELKDQKDIWGIRGLSNHKEIRLLPTPERKKLPYEKKKEDKEERLLCIKYVLFSEDKKRLIFYPQKRKGRFYRIPKGVESIERGAFKKNPFLEKVSFPRSILEVNGYAFRNCENLSEIYFEDGEIGEEGYCLYDYAFRDCDSLSTYSFGNRLRYLGTSNTLNCSLSSYTFPEGFRDLDDFNFRWCERFSFPKTCKRIGSLYTLFLATYVRAYEGTAKGLINALYENRRYARKIDLCVVLKNGKEVHFILPGELDGLLVKNLAWLWNQPSLDFQKFSILLPRIENSEERALLAKGILLSYKNACIPKQVRKALRPFALQYCKELIKEGDEVSFQRFLEARTLSKEDMTSLLEYCNDLNFPAYAAVLMEEYRKREGWQQQNQFRL